MPCSCGPTGCGAHKRNENFDPDFEGPSDADIAKFGSDDITCPECGAPVYYDAPLCPKCGHAMMDGERTTVGKRNAMIIAVGAALALIGFVFVSML